MKTAMLFFVFWNSSARRTPKGAPRARHGFSLVEVVLALGVTSMSMLGMLSLTIVGITSMREAMEQTVHTQIVQRISSEVQLTPYDSLDTTVVAKTFFFNGEAIEQTSADANTRYKVTLDRQTPSFPTSGAMPDMERSLTSVRIYVTPMVGDTPQPIARISTYVVLVPNSGEL
ncbi:hypothetical protein DB346_11950 [Verrucomicrobia bacterium LW23]|nr:hypothetical protein DB346_11950 [Verrucomicrobia bacterium LW23]